MSVLLTSASLMPYTMLALLRCSVSIGGEKEF